MEVIENALVLAAARRMVRRTNAPPLAGIRSLAYFLPVIEEGIKSLEKALELDKEYDDSMAYLNLLHRERADVADTKEAYQADTDAADKWVQKTLETKKIKASRAAPGSGTAAEGK